MSLKPIVLVDLLGLEKLSSAFGLALLFQGIGALAGPPLAGLSMQPRSARMSCKIAKLDSLKTVKEAT